MGGWRRARIDPLDGRERNDRQEAGQDERDGGDQTDQRSIAARVLIHKVRCPCHVSLLLSSPRRPAPGASNSVATVRRNKPDIGRTAVSSMNEMKSIQHFQIQRQN